MTAPLHKAINSIRVHRALTFVYVCVFVFQFSEELESPENKGRIKAEIGDIFSFTSVGHKHLMRSAPSEDR